MVGGGGVAGGWHAGPDKAIAKIAASTERMLQARPSPDRREVNLDAPHKRFQHGGEYHECRSGRNPQPAGYRVRPSPQMDWLVLIDRGLALTPSPSDAD